MLKSLLPASLRSVQRLKVNEVFTPRKPEVNNQVYVDRQGLERELKRALEGSLHPIVFGESGSGKSWLYKKVLSDMDALVWTANCANATSLRYGSLTAEIGSIVAHNMGRRLIEQSEEMHAEANVYFAKGGGGSTRKYAFTPGDSVMECFAAMRSEAGGRTAVLVIDNLEMIFKDAERMEELASILTLLDDARYAEYAVKLLVVGVPADVRTYLAATNSSVANRVQEISEVSSLAEAQVDILVKKGFVDLLNVSITPEVLASWQKHIFFVTMGFAQPVQEYCEQLGYIAEDAGWLGTAEQLTEADEKWFKMSLTKAGVVIANRMNERETKAGRRNQVLYSLGKLANRQFSAAEVESLVRQEFPQGTVDTTLAVGQILAELLAGEDTIISRSAKSANYEFRDAKYAMALRVLLIKDPATEKVGKVLTYSPAIPSPVAGLPAGASHVESE